jgi:hypothetical protein
MTRRRLFGAAILVILVAGLAILPVARPAAQSRERSLYVSVVDATGAPVEGIGPSDLLVKEDNLTREVLRVTGVTEPMQIAVLVDTSQSARDHISHIRQALPDFIRTLTLPNDAGRRNEIAIIGIGERPTILSEYAIDARDIQKGIDRIWEHQGSGAYMLDAIAETSKGLKKREAVRPVIVAIATEGVDFSNVQHDQAIDPMMAVGAAFYPFMLGQPNTSTGHNARERAQTLDDGPRLTGGYHTQLLTSMALGAKLKLLADQLTHMYKVTYGRPESLIPPERTTVSATNPKNTARGTRVIEAKR